MRATIYGLDAIRIGGVVYLLRPAIPFTDESSAWVVVKPSGDSYRIGFKKGSGRWSCTCGDALNRNRHRRSVGPSIRCKHALALWDLLAEETALASRPDEVAADGNAVEALGNSGSLEAAAHDGGSGVIPGDRRERTERPNCVGEVPASDTR